MKKRRITVYYSLVGHPGHTDDFQTPYLCHAGNILRYDSLGFIDWNLIDTTFFSPEFGSGVISLILQKQ
jgi:hypothetical protein